MAIHFISGTLENVLAGRNAFVDVIHLGIGKVIVSTKPTKIVELADY